MGIRFDELELTLDPFVHTTVDTPPKRFERPAPLRMIAAPRYRRILTCLIDLSLLAALALALSPLIPDHGGIAETVRREWMSVVALAGFLLIVSYHYYAGSWILWGKTIGGSIFDVKVVDADGLPISFPNATRRWASGLFSLLLGGVGFMLAGLPHRRSLPDILSESQCVMDERAALSN